MEETAPGKSVPSAYAKCPSDWESSNAKLLAAAKPGFKFDLVHTLLKRVQDETMPVSVEGRDGDGPLQQQVEDRDDRPGRDRICRIRRVCRS